MTDISELLGKTITAVDGAEGHDVLSFTVDDGTVYEFYHEQDCCESVAISEIIGDLKDLIGSPILEAEEISNVLHPAPENADSYTWTFYKFGTIKGHVNVRWLGESNGYYSESVQFRRVGE